MKSGKNLVNKCVELLKEIEESEIDKEELKKLVDEEIENRKKVINMKYVYEYIVLDTYSGKCPHLWFNNYYKAHELVQGYEILQFIGYKKVEA